MFELFSYEKFKTAYSHTDVLLLLLFFSYLFVCLFVALLFIFLTLSETIVNV